MPVTLILVQTGGDSCLAEHGQAYRNPKPNPTFPLPPGFRSQKPKIERVCKWDKGFHKRWKKFRAQAEHWSLGEGKYILDTSQHPKISLPEFSKLIHTLILTPLRTNATIMGLLGAFLKAPFGFPLLTNVRCTCSESTFQVPLGAGHSLLCALQEKEEDDVPWKDAATRWQTQFNQHKTISAALWGRASLQFLLAALLPRASHACEFRGVGIVRHWGPIWAGRETMRTCVPHFNQSFLPAVLGTAEWLWLTSRAQK